MPPDYGQVGEPSVSGLGTGGAEGTAAVVVPSGPTSLDKLAAAQGEGWKVTSDRPAAATDKGIPIPNTYTVVLSGPNGGQRVATVVTAAGADISDPRTVYTVSDIQEPVKPSTAKTPAETNADILTAQSNAVTAATKAKAAEDEYLQLQKENQQRDANLKSSGYWVNDKELADIKARGAEQGLTQQQINNQLRAQSDSNQVARETNLIATQRAATDAWVAQKNAEASAAQIEAMHDDRKLDQAKFLYTQTQNDIANRLAQDELKLKQLNQEQSNKLAQAAQTTSEQTLEQRRTEAGQTAETAAMGQAMTGAASIYGTERQAQTQAAQTGANLLQARATSFGTLANQPFQQAASLSQGSAGRFGMIGGGIQAPIPLEAFQGVAQGAFGTSAALLGGQSTLQAAVQAIEAARPGATQTPEGQAALATYHQISDRIGQLLNKGNMTGPTTTGGAAPTAAFVPPTTAPGFGGGPYVGAPNPNAFGSGVGAFAAPQTVPPQPFAQSGIPEGSNRNAVQPPRPTMTITF